MNDPQVLVERASRARAPGYSLESTLPYLLNRAGTHIGNAFNQELKRFDLSVPEWRILAALAQSNDQSLTELAAHTAIEISTLSRLVAAAQRRGLLARKKNGEDARSIAIRLAPAGRALAVQIIPLAELYERIALAGIEPAEVARLKRLLGRVFENIASLGPARPSGTTSKKPRQ